MPKGPPKDVKKMRDYSSPPQTATDVSSCLRAHYMGYVEWEGVEDFIAGLPVKLQQTVNLYYGDWRTIEDTAEVMGCSVWSVNSYLKVVRDLLLEKYGTG